MKIYTKTGDTGKTSLIGGRRVSKHHARIEAYGTVDELNAFVGLLRDHLPKDDPTRELLLEIQEKLFCIESHLADGSEGKLSNQMPGIQEEDIVKIELAIDQMSSSLPALHHFILPGGHPLVSYCHIARTVCRRAERLCTQLSENHQVEELDLKYLNRLSDYFFIVGRWYSKQTKSPEILWKP
ncbi:MAG: cob(I)yrinic acid a,c-diamide adenosyltransferase [Bacteroidales bacterium]|nr:cob(I)yrinic acid a,c-diamide adenosyltransferase [Bacteroidales bacterium]